jgi:predicted transcriptional regulator
VNWQLTRVSGRSGWKSDIGGRSVCPNDIYNVDIVYGCRPCVRSAAFPTAKSRHLADLCEPVRQPRAAIIREAIAEFLERNTVKSIDLAYGLWGAEGPDGLAYQEKARTEW